MRTTDVKDVVRQKYGEAAERVSRKGAATPAAAAPPRRSGNATRSPPTSTTPRRPPTCRPRRCWHRSGCGNPTALAELKEGETVLDLGAGGGIDVLLSARRVGPDGHGLRPGHDRPDARLAEENKRKSGLTNVHFLKGEIEHIPLPANSVDVIISNCVINLSADKDRVLREAFRVLRPGGRFAVSDVVVRGDVPASIRQNMELWIGCVAGALRDSEYLAKLAAAGFEAADIEVTRVYTVEDAREFLASQSADMQQLAHEVDGKFVSGFVRARKPLAAAAASSAPATPAAAPAQAGCGCGPKCCGS
jgi:arsenite methyltransferase